MSQPFQARKRIAQPQSEFFSPNSVSRKWWLADPIVLDSSDPSYLCDICRYIDFEYLIFKCSFMQMREEIPLDKLSLVLQRHQCAFCRLVRQTLEHHLGLDTVSSLIGDDSFIVSMLGVFRYYLTANTEPWQLKICIKPTPPKMDPNPPLLIHYVESGDWTQAIVSNRGTLLSSEANLLKAKLWILQCEQGLGSCQVQPQSPKRHALPAGFRLVDVEDKCVIEADGSYSYAALSYAWGNVKSLRLSRANRNSLAVKDSLVNASDPISQTILDAMEATRKLSQRYLWVDTLCIPQDDDVVFKAQLDAMGEIYSQSYVTIAATYGDDASAGLPGIQPQSRNARRSIERIQDIGMAPKAGEFNFLVDKSHWNSRGWTYQERLLARRVLFFTAEQLFFKCEHHDEPQAEENASLGTRRLTTSDPISDGGRDLIPQQHSINTMTYKQTVEAYTQRNLSKPEDILNAFAGVSQYLSSLFRSRMLFGLPETELVLGLLWRPNGQLVRRIDQVSRAPIFPSWSWAGWEGSVRCVSGHLLPRVIFVHENGEVHTCDELRQPASLTGQASNQPWWRDRWTEVTHSDSRAYYYENAADPNAWFAHPTAPLDSRSDLSILHPQIKGAPSSMLKFWAEAVDVDMKNFIPPADIQHPIYWYLLFDKATFQNVGGMMWIPAQHLKDLAQKKLDLIRVARIRSNGEPKENDWKKVLERDTLEASAFTRSATSPPENFYDQEVSPTPDYFPDRPVLDRSKGGIDQQRFDMRKPFCCYELLLIEWVRPEVAERIGHATVHIDFWAREMPTFKLITLA